MNTIELKVKELDHESFKDYGTVISEQDKEPAMSDEEIDVWRVIDLLPEKEIMQVNWLEQKKPRPLILSKMDCHMNCSEAYIPIQGQSIQVVALNKNGKDGKNIPDLETLNAFHIDGSKGLCMNPSVWHWLPFPISQNTKFTIVSMKDKINLDTKIVDLEIEFDFCARLIL